MKRFVFVPLAAMLVWAGLFTCAKRIPVVATVGGEAVTLDAFKEYFSKGKSKADIQSATQEELRAGLNELIKQRMKILVAYEMGLDKDSTVTMMSEGVLRHHLLQRLFQNEIMDRVITEKDIRDFYAKQANDVIFRTIFIECPLSANPDAVKAAEAKVAEVLKKLRGGADFAEVARQYSEDKETALNGGMAGAITYQRSNDELQNLIFDTRPGRIAGPVRNNLGFHIIKVEEIRKRERKPFDEARIEIEQSLRMERRRDISGKAQLYQDNLLKQHKVVHNEPNIVLLADTIKALSESGERDVLGFLAKTGPDLLTRPLATYSNGEMNIQDFIRRLKTDPNRGRLSLRTTKELNDVIENWLLSDFLVEVALKKGYLKDKQASKPYTDVVEMEMIRVLNQKLFNIKEDPSDAVLSEYYEKIKTEKFALPEKRQVQEIMADNLETLKTYRKMVVSGQDFGAVARAHTKRPGYQSREGNLGFISEKQWGIIGKTAFTLQRGEISEPIQLENNRGYSIIRVTEIEPSGIEPFNNVKDRVRYEYKDMLKKQKEAEWMEEQKKSHRVFIDEAVLADAFHEA